MTNELVIENVCNRVFPFFADRIRNKGKEPGQNIGSFSSSEGRGGMRHESGKNGTWQVKRHVREEETSSSERKAEWKEEEIRAKGDQAVAVVHTQSAIGLEVCVFAVRVSCHERTSQQLSRNIGAFAGTWERRDISTESVMSRFSSHF